MCIRDRYYSDNGADEILVFDLSDADEDHELSIGVLKEICRAAEAVSYTHLDVYKRQVPRGWTFPLI